VAGFNYSPGLKQAGGNWTIADLFNFVTNPKAMVPGTAMTFTGISRAGERADLMAYPTALIILPLNKGAEIPASMLRQKRRMTLQRVTPRVVDHRPEKGRLFRLFRDIWAAYGSTRM
jgi:hypothetical protein